MSVFNALMSSLCVDFSPEELKKTEPQQYTIVCADLRKAEGHLHGFDNNLLSIFSFLSCCIGLARKAAVSVSESNVRY